MTGPEHYREAERLLSEASFIASPDDPQPVTRGGFEMNFDAHRALILRAQTHAILAHAAAASLPTVTQFMGDSTLVTEWGQATGWVNPAIEEKAGE